MFRQKEARFLCKTYDDGCIPKQRMKNFEIQFFYLIVLQFYGQYVDKRTFIQPHFMHD